MCARLLPGELTFDLLCRMRAESSLLDSPITPAWSLASHHSTRRSTSLAFFPSCSAASAVGNKARQNQTESLVGDPQTGTQVQEGEVQVYKMATILQKQALQMLLADGLFSLFYIVTGFHKNIKTSNFIVLVKLSTQSSKRKIQNKSLKMVTVTVLKHGF